MSATTDDSPFAPYLDGLRPGAMAPRPPTPPGRQPPVPIWLRRQVNPDSFGPADYLDAVGHINSEPWEGFPAGSVRLVNLDFERAAGPDGSVGWRAVCVLLPVDLNDPGDPCQLQVASTAGEPIGLYVIHGYADFNAALGQGWEEVSDDAPEEAPA
jgi:hypothetical protein